MSIARKGPGCDVYVYTTGETWVCQECSLYESHRRRPSALLHTPTEMSAHLYLHILAGELVPAEAFAHLALASHNASLAESSPAQALDEKALAAIIDRQKS